MNELFSFLINLFKSKSGVCNVTIVRRYGTPVGYNGELYVDGKQIGMTCDNLIGSNEVYRHPLRVSFSQGRWVLQSDAYSLDRGDFTKPLAIDSIVVGSDVPTENNQVLSRLITAVSKYDVIYLTILNRIVCER